MVNINSIENDKKNIIKKFKPNEMKAYLNSLITILYEAYLEHDEEKALPSKKLIEEATSIYEAEGYSNSLAVELGLRLNEANNVLAKTLTEKHEQEIELSKVIVENAYSEDISRICHDNSILKTLIASYEEKPSEELASVMKEIIFKVESNLIGIKFILENKEFTENNVYAEETEILKEEYSTFESLATKINSF